MPGIDPLRVPQIRKAIPKPFQRKRIEVGTTVRRDWQQLPARDVRPGDVVANMGSVLEAQQVTSSTVVLTCGVPESPKSYSLDADHQLYVFSVVG